MLNEKYWSERYKAHKTGWDIGFTSTPIKEYINQLRDKDIFILIPGAGNAYEAEYFWDNGFKNITVLDISEAPLINLKKRVPSFAKSQLVQADFFHFNGQFDLIIEQTFFCALDPSKRTDYVQKMNELLKPSGKLVGLLFNIPLYQDHPPFWGNQKEYEALFAEKFKIKTMEIAYNSIAERAGNELFINMSPIKI